MNRERLNRIGKTTPVVPGSTRAPACSDWRPRQSVCGSRPEGTLELLPRVRTSAFSLIEIMVTVTLLSLIVFGLLGVFSHLQGALRAVNNQSDIFEGARATASLVSRDIMQLDASEQSNVVNLIAYNVAGVILPRPGGGPAVNQTNVLQDLFILTRENDTWTGVGYFIDPDFRSDGVGTLYRFSVQTNDSRPNRFWLQQFTAARIGDTNVHRVTDGVVNFSIRTFDRLGQVYLPTLITNNVRITVDNQLFRDDALPAFVEVELGVLEPTTLRQFKALDSADPMVARNFLTDQLGKMHFFRQRIPIRNHQKPEPIY